jgi:two-component system response regulator AtoC
MADDTTTAFLPRLDDPSARRLMIIHAGRVTDAPLPGKGVVLIGRGQHADVRIDDSRVSREHARLHLGECIELEDLGSANGTTLRNRLVSPRERVVIQPAEGIGIGNAVVMLQHGGLERAPRSAQRTTEKPSFKPDVPAGTIIKADSMKRVYELAERVALGDINVLILGETGSGKELLAERIHAASPRAGTRFLSINCAALSESLLESELFGHERGAFTGANQAKAGLMESVDGGTLFLDEIGEMTASVQAKMLRALETGQVLRVGSTTPRDIDVRFVSATNRNLVDEVARGRFRRDLYFRLNTVTLSIPPLRERRTEVLLLAEHFIRASLKRTGGSRPAPALAPDAIAALETHEWPGNVRELRGAVERALLLADKVIRAEHLQLETRAEPEPMDIMTTRSRPAASNMPEELEELERRRILEALELFTGNQTRAAEHLGISRRTLLNRLDEYGFPRPRKR